MKIIITEDQKKKLFIPRKMDEREIEFKKMIENKLNDIKNSPFGKLSKDQIFEWLQENNLDQELKLSYKGPSLGEVVMTSNNKSNGEVTVYFDGPLGSAIRYKISDIQVGYIINDMENDDQFFPID